MLDGAISAVAALRVLRNRIEARLQENEDFRVLQALDQALAAFRGADRSSTWARRSGLSIGLRTPMALAFDMTG